MNPEAGRTRNAMQLPETLGMTEELFCVGRTACTVFRTDTPHFLLLQPTGAHERERLAQEASALASASGDYLLAAFETEDWNRSLSPWRAPAVFGDASFGDGAAETLAFLEETLLPALKAHFALPEGIPVILGGYSLAGLFSLWCVYRSDAFAAAAAVSPSVWFDGWLRFAREHRPRAGAVYLSLGDREEKTKNRTLAAVGGAIREQYDMLRRTGVLCTLEWNAGGHFRAPDERCAKGFAWCMNTLRDMGRQT